MGAILFILIVVLLITAGVVTSVRLYTRGAVGMGRGHFRRIRRVRALPTGNVVEEEIIEEEAPIEEEA